MRYQSLNPVTIVASKSYRVAQGISFISLILGIEAARTLEEETFRGVCAIVSPDLVLV